MWNFTFARLDNGHFARLYAKNHIHREKSGPNCRMYAKNHIKRRDSPSIPADECEKPHKIATVTKQPHQATSPSNLTKQPHQATSPSNLTKQSHQTNSANSLVKQHH
ncbi:hypothetical protein [Cohnella fermenti]|uniref:Uncharacterized protein n=1 Tax=Cohnella fermenti TaxID=2565925 RepID=A0A4S4BPS6_9BACL|nr:hypothetical protein [Cohnella fermenti]THF76902.1 hypothetical protein E6C55_17725 [Cohnella fermenti]